MLGQLVLFGESWGLTLWLILSRNEEGTCAPLLRRQLRDSRRATSPSVSRERTVIARPECGRPRNEKGRVPPHAILPDRSPMRLKMKPNIMPDMLSASPQLHQISPA